MFLNAALPLSWKVFISVTSAAWEHPVSIRQTVIWRVFNIVLRRPGGGPARLIILLLLIATVADSCWSCILDLLVVIIFDDCFYLFISICVSLLENTDCQMLLEFVETVCVLFFVYYDVCVCKLLFERARYHLFRVVGKSVIWKFIYVVCFYARLDTDLVLLSRIDWLFRLVVVSVIFWYCPNLQNCWNLYCLALSNVKEKAFIIRCRTWPTVAITIQVNELCCLSFVCFFLSADIFSWFHCWFPHYYIFGFCLSSVCV